MKKLRNFVIDVTLIISNVLLLLFFAGGFAAYNWAKITLIFELNNK